MSAKRKKPIVSIEPTAEYKLPYDTTAEKPLTFQDELTVTANTMDILEELGMSIEMSQEAAEQATQLVKQAIKDKATIPLQQVGVAFAAKEFIRQYANQLATDVGEVRSAITAKLLELANCGDPRFELKALELLGKHSDVGLFTERSEVIIHYKNSTDLEEAIRERVRRLLNADVTDVTSLADTLDEELRVDDIDSLEANTK